MSVLEATHNFLALFSLLTLMLLDIHTHRQAPYPEGIISVEPSPFSPVEGQTYSAGVHPWHLGATPEEVEEQCRRLAEIASLECIRAIGEAGFDTLRGAPMMLQSLAFRRQVDLSEQLKKPLVIHCVKTLDMIRAWRRESGASQPWIVHGFRGKPQAARQLLAAGCFISFGEKFNEETLRCMPAEACFAETDESPLPIEDIIALHSLVRGEDMKPVIEKNMQRLFPTFG